MPWEWKLVQRQCTGCGICADLCPHGAIHMPREVAYPEVVSMRCIGCMTCVEQCPLVAIEVVERLPAAI